VRAEGTGWLPELPPALEYRPPGEPATKAQALAALDGIRGALG